MVFEKHRKIIGQERSKALVVIHTTLAGRSCGLSVWHSGLCLIDIDTLECGNYRVRFVPYSCYSAAWLRQNIKRTFRFLYEDTDFPFSEQFLSENAGGVDRKIPDELCVKVWKWIAKYVDVAKPY